MKKVNTMLGVVGACLVISGSTQIARAEAPAVKLVDIGFSGDGCPSGPVATPTGDPQFPFRFDELVAQTIPGGPTTARKHCQMQVTLELDPAWSVGIESVQYRGFATLEAGAVGEQRSRYFFASQPPAGDLVAKTTLKGPFKDTYDRRDDMTLLLWSPCGPSQHQLVINVDVRVTGGIGLMTLDSFSGVDLRFKRCP